MLVILSIAIVLTLIWISYIVWSGYRILIQPQQYRLPDEYRPRFIDGEWKSGFEITKELSESEQEMMRTLGLFLKGSPSPTRTTDTEYINLWGKPHRWNPDKKQLESVDE